MNNLRDFIPPIHHEGHPYILILLCCTVLSYIIWPNLFWFFLILTLCCSLFFRDPDRVSPDNPHAILSAADGTVTAITRMKPPKELAFLTDDEVIRVSTFLSVFDVHVNRIPISGTICAMHYHPGAFISATLDKSSDENERQLITIERPDKTRIGVVQIAGLIARRIVCTIKENEAVTAGERFGIIRFGSRVDIYLPAHMEVCVKVGQTMIGGETIVAIAS